MNKEEQVLKEKQGRTSTQVYKDDVSIPTLEYLST